MKTYQILYSYPGEDSFRPWEMLVRGTRRSKAIERFREITGPGPTILEVRQVHWPLHE